MLNQYGIPVKDYEQNGVSYERRKPQSQMSLLDRLIPTKRTNVRRTRQRTDVEQQWGI